MKISINKDVPEYQRKKLKKNAELFGGVYTPLDLFKEFELQTKSLCCLHPEILKCEIEADANNDKTIFSVYMVVDDYKAIFKVHFLIDMQMNVEKEPMMYDIEEYGLKS